jgi:hypothetical protein
MPLRHQKSTGMPFSDPLLATLVVVLVCLEPQLLLVVVLSSEVPCFVSPGKRFNAFEPLAQPTAASLCVTSLTHEFTIVLFSGIVGVAYPTFATFKAIEGRSASEKHTWLT